MKKWFLSFFIIILAVYAATNTQVDNANPLDLNDYSLIMGSGSDIGFQDEITALTLNQKFAALNTKITDIETNLLTQIADLENQLANQPVVTDCTDPANVDNPDCTSLSNPVAITSCEQLSTTEDFNGNSVATYQESSCYINGETSTLGGCFISTDGLECLSSCSGSDTDKKCDIPTVSNFAYIAGSSDNLFSGNYTNDTPITSSDFLTDTFNNAYINPRRTLKDSNGNQKIYNSTSYSMFPDEFRQVIWYTSSEICAVYVFGSNGNGAVKVYNTPDTHFTSTPPGRDLTLSECKKLAAHLYNVSENSLSFYRPYSSYEQGSWYISP